MILFENIFVSHAHIITLSNRSSESRPLSRYTEMIDRIKKKQGEIELLLEGVSHCLLEYWNRNRSAQQSGESSLHVMTKEDQTLVSAADYESNALLKDGLSRLFPEVPICSEEDEEIKEVSKRDAYWLIDPLDGTARFLDGYDDFAILVAFISSDGMAEAGWVVFPAKRLTFWAIDASCGVIGEAQGEVLSLSKRDAMKRERVYLRWDAGEGKTEDNGSHGIPSGMKSIGLYSDESLHTGAAFLSLLTGALDGVILQMGRLQEWDVGAPAAIIRALGGGVYGIDGKEFRFGTDEKHRVFMASSRNFQRELLEIATTLWEESSL